MNRRHIAHEMSVCRVGGGLSRRVVIGGVALGGAALAGGLASRPARANVITMRFGSDSPINAPHTLSAVRIKQYVEKHTDGRVNVQIFPNSQLGDSQAMTISVKSGALDAVITDVANVAGGVPGADVFNIPFLFKDTRQVLRAANGELGARLKPRIESAFNCEIIGWATDGERNFWDKKRPIRTPDDMKGLKIRIASSSTILRDTYLALGAIPTPLAFSETYTGLESGVVDGSDMGVFDMLAFKVYQVAKFLTLTRQFSVVNPLIVGKAFMARISPADRQVVRDAGKLGADAQVRAILTGELVALDQLRAKGVRVFEPTDRNAFVAKVQPVHAEATARVGADIMKLAQAAASS